MIPAFAAAKSETCRLERKLAVTAQTNTTYSIKVIEVRSPQECFEEAVDMIESYPDAPCSPNQTDCNPDFNYIDWEYDFRTYGAVTKVRVNAWKKPERPIFTNPTDTYPTALYSISKRAKHEPMASAGGLNSDVRVSS